MLQAPRSLSFRVGYVPYEALQARPATMMLFKQALAEEIACFASEALAAVAPGNVISASSVALQ
eukprot:3182081-Heterocapsa_arctica.AAC.1